MKQGMPIAIVNESDVLEGLVNKVRRLPTEEFFFEVAKGNVVDHDTGTIFGRNQDVDPAAAELLWDYGGLEVYLTADTELFLSSDNAGDTNVNVFVWGLDENYAFKIETHLFTSGLSQQSIGNFFRLFRLVVVAGGDAPLGDIYCAEADTHPLGIPDTPAKVHALMAAGDGVTHKASGTVPAGYTMHVVRMFQGVRRAEDTVIVFRSKAFGAPMFVESTSFPLYQSSGFFTFSPPFIIAEKTDFEFLASTVTNNTEVTLNIGYILVRNPT
jgi:hypothetical protein